MAKDEAVIFLVDDDELYLLRLKDHLQEKLYFKASIITYLTGEECMANLELDPDIIVLDYYFNPSMPTDPNAQQPMNGIELIRRVKEAKPSVHLIMLSCETDVEVANTAIKEGAKDYIVKYEFAPIQLQFLINNIILSKELNPRRNIWKQVAIVAAALIIVLVLYLVFSGQER